MAEEKEGMVRLWDAVPGCDFNEEIDLADLDSWFFDGTHSVPLLTPMYSWFWMKYCGYGSQYSAEILSLPRYKGFTLRNREGGTYIAMRIAKDEAEVEERTKKFREALIPWIEDFDGIWGGYREELLNMYENLKAVDLEKATSVELMHHLWDMISTSRRMWEIHFLGMNVSYAAFMLLEDLVKPYGLTVESPEFQNMFRGFDNKVFQVDRKLWELGKDAVEKGLGDVILNSEIGEVKGKLEESEVGQEWLRNLHDFLEVDGWRMVRMMDFDEPYWLEDPSTVISPIRAFIKKGGDYNLDKMTVELAAGREKAIKELLQKVPDDEKAWFEALINLGGKSSSYSEEHDLYCELYLHAVQRRGFLGIGRRFAEAGALDKPDDIFFLNPDEVEMALMGPEYHKLQYIANRRRERWEKIKFSEVPPVFTNRASLEEAVGMDLMPSADPIIIKIVVGELPRVREELKADIYGVCGAPGVAEGPARVIMSYNQLDEVQKGDILVCPGTNPAWTPVFGLVKAVVSDRGGTLSHTAIVGREYGLPTLVNTFTGTSTIKTGQKIKVDATEGALYILDK
ncbi:MAG: phosphoenolpyruvate-utilizing protein [Deltaproteobacteria bacterium]|nr:phosphoenolpyruvate-utilizing protein [Deltaproteobacteria bacterium]